MDTTQAKESGMKSITLPAKPTLTRYQRYEIVLRQRRRAMKRVRYAVVAGHLVKPNVCEGCKMSAVPLDAHHEDYSQPLVVRWFCKRCHVQTHTARRMLQQARAYQAQH